MSVAHRIQFPALPYDEGFREQRPSFPEAHWLPLMRVWRPLAPPWRADISVNSSPLFLPAPALTADVVLDDWNLNFAMIYQTARQPLMSIPDLNWTGDLD